VNRPPRTKSPAATVVAVAFAVTGAGGCGTAVIDPVEAPTEDIGLVAHWAFDDGAGSTAKDSSRNRHDGVLTGGTWTAGRFGGALFLKRGEFVSVAEFPQAMPSLSVSLWVKFANGDLASGRSPLIGSELNGGGWEVNAPDDSNPPKMEFNYPGARIGGDSNYLHLNCCEPTVDTWMHIVATVDGGTRFINMFEGDSVRASTTADSLIMPGNTTFSIGAANTDQFQGTVDEIRIYDRVLTQAEISVLNNGPR